MNTEEDNNVRPPLRVDVPPMYFFNYDLRSRAQTDHTLPLHRIVLPRTSIDIQKEHYISIDHSHPEDKALFTRLYNAMRSSLRWAPASRSTTRNEQEQQLPVLRPLEPESPAPQ